MSPASVTPTELKVTFDPRTPIEKLLPAAPKARAGRVRLPQALAQVPELALQDAPAGSLELTETIAQTARTIDRIHHINHKKTDAFMETLLANRRDLAGLPFAMGDACRLQDESARQFANAVTSMRNARGPRQVGFNFTPGSTGSTFGPQDPLLQANPGDALLANFVKLVDDADRSDKRVGPSRTEQALKARVALVTQVLSHEAPALRLGMVKYLATLSHVDATRALARLAIFADDKGVRRAAADALKTRREKDYTSILLDGLRYPWPDVARNAAEAIVQLQRDDLTQSLIDVLERPDPRAPQMRETDGQKVEVVRELVKINHHRNCLMCHAPLEQESVRVSQDRAAYLQTLSVQVPQPAEELPAPFAPSARYYDNTNPDILVRVDVTYLRQDFSVKLPVADASQTWPEMQRFDFVVRTREVTEEEARAYRDELEPRQAGVLSPYHRAALFALRELTGLDTAPTAQAWRQLLQPK